MPSRRSEAVLQPLMAAPLLVSVPDAQRRTIFRALEGRTVAAGTAILEQGVPNDRLWFVVDGTVEVARRYADGRVDRLATLSGPAIYGTTTFFRGSALTATIRATADLPVWTLDRAGLDRIREQDPRAAEGLALAVVRVLSERFDLLDQRLAELIADHADDHPRANEWANFRTRLFEEPAL